MGASGRIHLQAHGGQHVTEEQAELLRRSISMEEENRWEGWFHQGLQRGVDRRNAFNGVFNHQDPSIGS